MVTKYSNYIKENLNIEISVGDYVECIDFNDLTLKQANWLNSSDKFKVYEITDKQGNLIDNAFQGTKFVNVGYNIPLKMSRFKKINIDITKFKYKILFLQFDSKITIYDEIDTKDYFKGCGNMSQLFPKLFKEKLQDSFVQFSNYNDVYRLNNDYYINDSKLKEYDFIFFGFIAKHTNISSLIISYCERNHIKHLKYETYDHFHNKAYQFDLLDSLGYPYIPSILTNRLNSKIISEVEKFNYPVIVKDVYLDCGKGVFVINNKAELLLQFSNNQNLKLIQKFIPNDGEYRVITIKNKVQLVAKKDPVTEVNKDNLDKRRSKKGTLPSDVITMCEDISKHLFGDIIGFDIIQDINTKKWYIIETNSSPHMTMFSVVAEVNLLDVITNYIIKEIS